MSSYGPYTVVFNLYYIKREGGRAEHCGIVSGLQRSSYSLLLHKIKPLLPVEDLNKFTAVHEVHY